MEVTRIERLGRAEAEPIEKQKEETELQEELRRRAELELIAQEAMEEVRQKVIDKLSSLPKDQRDIILQIILNDSL